MKYFIYILLLIFSLLSAQTDNYEFKFGVLKYGGGGDWYEGLVGVKELMAFINTNLGMNCKIEGDVVEISRSSLYQYPFIYMTGHGNIYLTSEESKIIKDYLLNGGFLYANDDYGMDESFNREIKKMFPDYRFTELGTDHEIFNIYYKFPDGLPKIHKHDGGAPIAYGIYYNNRLIILYTFNTDIGDGWAPYQVHKDPQSLRIEALKMGLNLVLFSMLQ